MTKNQDARKMKSKFSGSKCGKCGKPINREETIVWFPATRAAFHEACGAADFSRAQQEVFDEEVLSHRGGYL